MKQERAAELPFHVAATDDLADVTVRRAVDEFRVFNRALVALDRMSLDPETVANTLGALLKYQDDIAKMSGSEAARMLAELKAASRLRATSPVPMKLSNAPTKRSRRAARRTGWRRVRPARMPAWPTWR